MKDLNLKRMLISIFLLWGLALISSGSGENDSFQIGDLKVNPGEIKSGYLSVPEKDGIGTLIPIISTPPTSKGEPLFEVGRVKQ